MATYAIGSLVIHHTDWQKEYGEKMPALIRKHGGTLRARAPVQQLHGCPGAPAWHHGGDRVPQHRPGAGLA